jgi:hypothetical protein
MGALERWFWSEETGQAFAVCASCRFPLLETDSPWLVNKDYAGGECVREYAVCQGCRDRLAAEVSEESKAEVRKFLETCIDWEARVEEFMRRPDGYRIAACVSCRQPRGELDAFGISAMFDSGGNLVTGPLPLLMCGVCAGRMTAGLCGESREAWRRFLERCFGDSAGGTGGWGMF